MEEKPCERYVFIFLVIWIRGSVWGGWWVVGRCGDVEDQWLMLYRTAWCVEACGRAVVVEQWWAVEVWRCVCWRLHVARLDSSF